MYLDFKYKVHPPNSKGCHTFYVTKMKSNNGENAEEKITRYSEIRITNHILQMKTLELLGMCVVYLMVGIG